MLEAKLKLHAIKVFKTPDAVIDVSVIQNMTGAFQLCILVSSVVHKDKKELYRYDATVDLVSKNDLTDYPKIVIRKSPNDNSIKNIYIWQ